MLRLENVSKRYANGQVAVHELSLEIPTGQTCALIGPSGCGKTTTLKMINRMIEPTGGRIFHDEEDVTHIDPVQLRLRMGYVIQQVGLFPHLTVAQNVATVPRLLGWDRRRTRARVDELLQLVGLEPNRFAKRYPHQLSGGQRQRVGVARALGVDPPVLLMDEPFGAIDRVARDRLQNEFLRIQHEMRKTVVFVTHDIDEAIKLGDRIAILREGGFLQQYDTPAQVLAAPASEFVADFLGHDRGQKRLSVTPINLEALEQPPTVPASASTSDARRELESTGANQLVVLDGDRLKGFLTRQHAAGDGTAGDRAEAVLSTVPPGATLNEALSEMLLHPGGWVAVVDGESYCGIFTLNSLQSSLRR
jgi:osmoprotectant transport system ATP-binding protein